MINSGSAQRDEGLIRALGIAGLTATTINAIIGSGIFAMPGSLAQLVGGYAAWMFVLGAVAMIPVTLCFAAAGSRVSQTGGVYAYVHAAFGPLPGFAGGALIWISNLTALSAVTAALADQAAAIAPVLAGPIPRAALIIGIIGALTALNALGIQMGARAMITFAILKLSPLIILVCVGLFFMQGENLHMAATPNHDALGTAMLMVIFAYSGIETAVMPSGEVRDPARTVPRAAITSLILIVLIYVGVQMTAQGVLGPALNGSKTPLADTAGQLWSPGRMILLITTSVSMLGLLAGSLLGNSRALYAFARDGYLPAALARIDARKVPLPALLTYAGLGIAIALLSNFEKLVLLSTGAVCMGYIGCCLAAWKLDRDQVTAHGKPFRLIAGPLIPILGVLLMAGVLTTLKQNEWIATLSALGVLVAYAALRGRLAKA